jgi:FkbM family methyltransferase
MTVTMNGRFSLLQLAGYFDLSSPEDRKFSCTTLVELFVDLQRFIRPKAFVEFGAFDANFSQMIRPLHPLSKVIAFEANPHNYKYFTSKIDYRAQNIEYNHLAISDRDGGTIDFHVQTSRAGVEAPPVKGDDSLLKRNVSENYDAYKETQYEICPVDTVRLDTFLCDAQFGLDDFSAWVDVEGALRTALAGAEKTLSRTRSIFIEVEERPFWSGQWLAPDVEKFLEQFGLIPIARDFEYYHQYNMIFVTKEVMQHAEFHQSMQRYYGVIGGRRSKNNA